MDCRHAPIRPLKWQKSFRRGRSAADHRTVRVTTHLRFPIIRDRLKPGCSKVDRAPLNRNAGEALRPSMSSGYPSMRPPFPDEAFLRLPPYRRGVLRALALRVIPHAPAFPPDTFIRFDQPCESWPGARVQRPGFVLFHRAATSPDNRNWSIANQRRLKIGSEHLAEDD